MGTRIFYRRGRKVEVEQLDDVIAQPVSGEQADAIDVGALPPELAADDTGTVSSDISAFRRAGWQLVAPSQSDAVGDTSTGEKFRPGFPGRGAGTAAHRHSAPRRQVQEQRFRAGCEAAFSGGSRDGPARAVIRKESVPSRGRRGRGRHRRLGRAAERRRGRICRARADRAPTHPTSPIGSAVSTSVAVEQRRERWRHQQRRTSARSSRGTAVAAAAFASPSSTTGWTSTTRSRPQAIDPATRRISFASQTVTRS